MSESETNPRAPAADRPRRWRWPAVALVSLLVLGALGAGLVVLSAPSEAAPINFRFENVYVSGPEGTAANSTQVAVESWFTNRGHEALRDVRLVVIVLDGSRGIAVDRADRSLGDLSARTTFDESLDVRLNTTQSYRIHLMVLVEGLLVARSEGHVGFRNFGDDAQRLSHFVLEGTFSHDYDVD